ERESISTPTNALPTCVALAVIWLIAAAIVCLCVLDLFFSLTCFVLLCFQVVLNRQVRLGLTCGIRFGSRRRTFGNAVVPLVLRQFAESIRDFCAAVFENV